WLLVAFTSVYCVQGQILAHSGGSWSRAHTWSDLLAGIRGTHHHAWLIIFELT
uniref:Uncharacterized protein n=1 Tax=Sciurus vulgaris TaxID=55149 RepID=A0A8D2AS19_SCIVU